MISVSARCGQLDSLTKIPVSHRPHLYILCFTWSTCSFQCSWDHYLQIHDRLLYCPLLRLCLPSFDILNLCLGNPTYHETGCSGIDDITIHHVANTGVCHSFSSTWSHERRGKGKVLVTHTLCLLDHSFLQMPSNVCHVIVDNDLVVHHEKPRSLMISVVSRCGQLDSLTKIPVSHSPHLYMFCFTWTTCSFQCSWRFHSSSPD